MGNPSKNKITPGKTKKSIPAKTKKSKGADLGVVKAAVAGINGTELMTTRIVRLNKSKCYDHIQRKAEPNCFSVGVINLNADTVCTLMNCKNPFVPKSKTEAKAIADGCQYVGAKIPGKVMDMLDTLPALTPKYVYCNLPFFDKKGECLTYGAKRDRAFDLQYDRAAKRVKGGVSDSRDVYESKALAEDGGCTLTTRIDLDPTEDEKDKTIHKLSVQNYGYESLCCHLVNALDVVIGETEKFHDAMVDACNEFPDNLTMEEVDPMYLKVTKAYKDEDWKELGRCLAERFTSDLPGDDIDTDAAKESNPEPAEESDPEDS